jgi:hypothetical protein
VGVVDDVDEKARIAERLRYAVERKQQIVALGLFLKAEGRRDWRASRGSGFEPGMPRVKRRETDAGFVRSTIAAADLEAAAARTAQPWLAHGLLGVVFRHWRWAMSQIEHPTWAYAVQLVCLDGLSQAAAAEELHVSPWSVGGYKAAGLGQMVDAMAAARRGEVEPILMEW